MPGVALVDTRIVKDVMLPLASEPDPVDGPASSRFPRRGDRASNDLHLRAGAARPAADDEAVILEQIRRRATVSQPGDALPVDDQWPAAIDRASVGIALSPEYVLAMSGRDMAPDNRRFVVLWMRRSAVAPAFRMEGAFNDVVLRARAGSLVPPSSKPSIASSRRTAASTRSPARSSCRTTR